jgi:hypothetical protein
LSRLFLLSPANCGGRRAAILMADRASFDLATRLRGPDGAPIGDVFSFMSGLYFRGKLAYARAFARPPDVESPLAGDGILVITPTAGLRPPETRVTREALRAFAGADVSLGNPGYRKPLEASARALRDEVGADCEVVLLGSVASGKYVDILQATFGDSLLFPADFVGRGDMSRGGLMLRCASSGDELRYVPVTGAVRHGPRPPKLEPLRGR